MDFQALLLPLPLIKTANICYAITEPMMLHSSLPMQMELTRSCWVIITVFLLSISNHHTSWYPPYRPCKLYQWQLNSFDIAGATSQSYNVLKQDCLLVVGIQMVVTILRASMLITGIDDISSEVNISIYPNPSSEALRLNYWIRKAPVKFQ